MPRRPRINGQRPAESICGCGNIFPIAAKGPIPVRCPRCRDSDGYGLAMAILMELPSSFRPRGRRGHDADVLRAMADRLEPADPVLVIDEILDRLDLATMTPETAARIARRLDASSKRVLRRAGLLRRGTP